MKILITGSTGLLGQAFQAVLKDSFELVTPTHEELDVTHAESVQHYKAEQDFDFVIHCAAYTAVDLAEREKDDCFDVNVKGIQNIMSLELPCIHFSTDYVFDGKETSYREDAERNPLNVYGASKAAAETFLETQKGDWWNIRTSWLYGKGGRNFIDTIAAKIKNQEDIQVVDDQIGRITNAEDLATYIGENFIKKTQPSGHYHLQGSGEPASWYKIAQEIQNILSRRNDQFGRLTIEPIKTTQLHQPAQRPSNSVLENTKIKADMPDWKLSLRKYL